MNYIFSKKYILSLDGKIRFTSVGREAFTECFKKAGINIQSVRTYQQYLEARAISDMYLMEAIEYPVDEANSESLAMIRSLFLGDIMFNRQEITQSPELDFEPSKDSEFHGK